MNWQFIVNELLKKMTQAELAALAGYSQPAISLLSSGKRKNVDYDVGQKLIALYMGNGIKV